VVAAETRSEHRMHSLILAAEGGYQQFELTSTEWYWLIFCAATAILALVVGLVLMRGVLAADQGTPKMIEIAEAIQEGAMAYLKRQFKTIAVIMVPVAILVFATSVEVVKPNLAVALGRWRSSRARCCRRSSGSSACGWPFGATSAPPRRRAADRSRTR
jgi:K(+)-stimulated pyrophosphate-energized sodium pump